jgi:predicted nucleic acid-binding Zn ribbon protein
MPLYFYANDETGEIHEVVQGMNDKHELEIDGKPMRRLFTVPNAAIQTKLNPFSQKDFVNKTANMKGTVGDMLDMSAEMSAARQEKVGNEDPVKRKFYDSYKDKVGKKHLADKPKSFENKAAKAEW